MEYVNVNDFPTPPVVVHIDKSRCDGCALCIEVCTTQALRIIPNRDRPGKRVVTVTARLCAGCGVCQATCPKEAIFVPGLSPSDLRRYINQALDMQP